MGGARRAAAAAEAAAPYPHPHRAPRTSQAQAKDGCEGNDDPVEPKNGAPAAQAGEQAGGRLGGLKPVLLRLWLQLVVDVVGQGRDDEGLRGAHKRGGWSAPLAGAAPAPCRAARACGGRCGGLECGGAFALPQLRACTSKVVVKAPSTSLMTGRKKGGMACQPGMVPARIPRPPHCPRRPAPPLPTPEEGEGKGDEPEEGGHGEAAQHALPVGATMNLEQLLHLFNAHGTGPAGQVEEWAGPAGGGGGGNNTARSTPPAHVAGAAAS